MSSAREQPHGWDRDRWAAEMVELAARLRVRKARRSDLAVLGLPAEATLSDVRSAFRSLALQHHPDHGGDSAEFRRLRAAHDRAVADIGG